RVLDPVPDRDRAGDGVRLAGSRSARLRGHLVARLPGDPGRGAHDRGDRRRGQPLGGLRLRVHRSTHPLCAIGALAAGPGGAVATSAQAAPARPRAAVRGRRLPRVSLTIIGVFVVAALFANVLSPADPEEQALRQRFTPPMWDERGTWNHVL